MNEGLIVLHETNQLIIFHLSLSDGQFFHLAVLYGKILQMDYRNILSQNVDGFLDYIMITGNVGLVQQIDRIQDDLEIGRLNGVQHFLARCTSYTI